MSDRIDTEAVRRAWPERFRGGGAGAQVIALCDEVDRTREALRIARFVAEHWRDAALDLPSDSQVRMMAHPLNLVMDALDGEADPVQLGVSPDAWDAFRAALAESGNTEPKACPTCRSTKRHLMAPVRADGVCPDQWHRATDTDRCPTCGSDDPNLRRCLGCNPVPYVGHSRDADHEWCPDPWHGAARPEGET